MDKGERNTIEEAVAEALRAERAAKDLTQTEVSRRTGIARTSYWLYEDGQRQPTITQLVQISDAMHIPLHQIIEEIERRVRQKLQEEADQIPDSPTDSGLLPQTNHNTGPAV